MAFRTRAGGLAVGAIVAGWVLAGVPAPGQELPKAGKEHAVLKRDAGTWDAEVKVWETPGSDPVVSKGTEVNTMLTGDLWLASEFDGEFAGLKFQGRGQTGYDPAKKKYVGTWVDSMAAGILMMEGTYDEATDTLTMDCDSVGPDGKPAKLRMVTRRDAQGRRVFTLSVKAGPDGGYVKMMEMTYTKRPGGK